MYAITATKIQDPPKQGQSPKIDPSGDSCPGSIHAGTAPQAPYVTTSPASRARGGELAARNEPPSHHTGPARQQRGDIRCKTNHKSPRGYDRLIAW
jgi:hypothetical protein